MRKDLSESEELEMELSLDDELQERINNMYLLKSALDRHAYKLVSDWGNLPFNVEDQFSYDLGLHDGLGLAVKLLQDANLITPHQDIVH